jgi:purine-binding chemotaxis protein CheW
MMAKNEVSTENPAIVAASQVLIIRIGNGGLACIDLNNVERTISLVALQHMPGSAAYVAGIMNYAGSSLVVIDLAIRLGLPSAPYKLDTPILICVHEHHRLGVIVSDIVGIQTLQQKDQQLTSELTGYGQAFRASAHTDQGLALMLDTAWLTQSELYQSADTRLSQVPPHS